MTDPRIRDTVDLLGLSVRQSEIAVCLAEGRSTRQVAELMGIGINSVGIHLHNVFIKLDINSRVQLMSLVLSNELEVVDSVGHRGRAPQQSKARLRLMQNRTTCHRFEPRSSGLGNTLAPARSRLVVIAGRGGRCKHFVSHQRQEE